MISKTELQRWLNTLPGDPGIGVDEGGLILVTDLPAVNPDGISPYLEIGGMPLDEEDEG